MKRVQGWIDKNDGKYACLFLCVFGIDAAGLKSEKSLLFIPDRGCKENIVSMFSPLHGEIDSYTIDAHLKELEDVSSLSLEEAKVFVEKKRNKEWLEEYELDD